MINEIHEFFIVTPSRRHITFLHLEQEFNLPERGIDPMKKDLTPLNRDLPP
jgi:hypothetical protein